jgi:ribosomal protein L21E
VKRVSIFLITVALIAGMVGCGGAGAGGGRESYTLTIDSTAGGVVTVDNVTIPGKAIFTYDAVTVVSLNATPDSGYQFVKWTGDVGTVDNVHASGTIITVNGNCSIMANFEVPPPVQYRLAIFSTAGGSVTTPGEGSFTYDTGTVVNLVATPASGYKFNKWTGDVGTIANVNAASTNITMSGNYYIAANFRDIPCTGLG